MDVLEILAQRGGMTSRRELRRSVSRSAIRGAVEDGLVVRIGRSHLALADLEPHHTIATELNGALTGLSAAMAHGMPVKNPPAIPHVLVPRGRHRPKQSGVQVSYGDPTEQELRNGVVTPLRTVIESARSLPFDEALCIADSALRMGLVEKDELVDAAMQSSRKGRSRAVRVALAADGRAANPFESVLRAIALEVVGLNVTPQFWVGDIGCADLVDPVLRLVLEADSYEFHGSKAGFKRDILRYNAFVLHGWLVLRFTWAQVMHHPDYVAECLRMAVELQLRCSCAKKAAS